jgi:UDP-GlcNAc:undecaprenyl-phosphate GlcNAc-1-phosphate transferase
MIADWRIDAISAVAAGTAFVMAYLCVPLARRFGARFGFMDAVNPAKIHEQPMVRCGGLGIVAGFALALILGLVIAPMLANSEWVPPSLRAHLPNISGVMPKLLAVLSGASILFLTGLVDDRKPLPPVPKLFLQILSAVPLILADITIRVFVDNEILSAVFTIAWVVLLTNAFNFLDNMNGLSSGVAVMCSINFLLLARAGGEMFMMPLIALFLGAVAGFIPHNFPKAKLFMGDSGSLFIGYMLAAISAMTTYYEAGVPTTLPVVAPLIVLGVPLFDTASVMLIRLRRGLPLMKGDQNHFSHRLVALGMSRVQAVLFIYLITLTVGLTAVNLRLLDWSGATLALLQVGLFFVIIFALEHTGRNRQK